MRTAKELLVASKEFAREYRWLSWWHLGSTFTVLAVLVAIAVSDLHWAIRAASSVLSGLVGVRLFIIYHDFQHGAVLRDSRFAALLMSLYGVVMLNPPSAWNRSHDHHHKHNSKTFGASIGSFPIMTTETYASASAAERFAYAAARHPLIMVLGYFTVFLWGMCLRPFLLNPRRHFDGAISIVVHVGLLIYLGVLGLDIMLFGLFVPSLLASSLGAYLFYAQHNYPAAKLRLRSEWSHVEAALHSSSYIAMGPLMNWFTGNIGYHHVHHLNARIPFYRLPEAMASLKELQSPGTTSLRPVDIAACLRLKLWSPDKDQFVGVNGSQSGRATQETSIRKRTTQEPTTRKPGARRSEARDAATGKTA
ncbi:MAG: fatty acid desaturase [Pirellulaceae bacterium]|jgi:omega-6 fatty acid desaturase (delta-12 desaturase)|nr:fatty acid desaturase [Pirellulaceae bacterium]